MRPLTSIACLTVASLLAAGCTEQNPVDPYDGGQVADGLQPDVGTGPDNGPGPDKGKKPDKGITPDKGTPPPDKGTPPPDKGPPPKASLLVSMPHALYFGAVTMGCGKKILTLTLSNPSGAALQIKGLNLVGCSAELGASVSHTGKIPPGGTRTGSVSLTPAKAGPKSCALHVVVSDGTLVVPISAQVVPKGTHTDTFKQALNRKVDILLAMDPSGSMIDEKARLKAMAPVFAAAAAAHKLDFHLGSMAIVKMKSGPLGMLFGTPAYVTKATPNLKAEFEKRIDLPMGSGNETGFDAIKAAISPPLTATANAKSCSGCAPPNACNKGACRGPNWGFRRADASLEVLAFSDEDDASATSLAAMTSLLKGLADPLKGRFARVHALLPKACAYPGMSFTNWKGLVAATGGEVNDLCAKDYTPAIKALTSRIFGLQDQFPLSGKPQPASIKVKVNGKAQAFTYDAKSNSVRMAKAPADKATVTVSYSPVCK